MTGPLVIREALASDLDIVIHHRRKMYEDMGTRAEDALARMEASSRPFFARALADGSYRGWLAEDGSGRVVAGGGVILIPFQPSPRDPAPRRPWIVNMYTEPEYRRQGLARRLMEAMVAWCRAERMTSVYLHASDDGRALYESLGFTPTNEMRLVL